MGVLKEFNCLEHGEFEGSHPICPAFGCRSRAVVQEFRTPPTIGSRMVRQFEAGMKKTSDMYHIRNFRTARAGESAHGGDAGKENGMQVLWGDSCRKVLGKSFAELTGIAQQPLVVHKRDGSGELRLERNNAMRSFANDGDSAGTYQKMAKRPVAKPGELRVQKGDRKSEPIAKRITA